MYLEEVLVRLGLLMHLSQGSGVGTRLGSSLADSIVMSRHTDRAVTPLSKDYKYSRIVKRTSPALPG